MNTWFSRKCVIGLAWMAATLAAAVENVNDGYIKSEGNCWTLGTASIERVIALEDGKLLLKRLRNKVTGRELACGVAAEFFLRFGDDQQLVTSAAGPWQLIRAQQTRLKQGNSSWT